MPSNFDLNLPYTLSKDSYKDTHTHTHTHTHTLLYPFLNF